MVPSFITHLVALAPLAFGVVGVVVTLMTALHVAFLALSMLPFSASGKAFFVKAASVVGVFAADLQKILAFFQKSAPPVSP